MPDVVVPQEWKTEDITQSFILREKPLSFHSSLSRYENKDGGTDVET